MILFDGNLPFPSYVSSSNCIINTCMSCVRFTEH